MNNQQKSAAVFCEAIKRIARNPESLRKLEDFLSSEFPRWMKEDANTPENMSCDMADLAGIEVADEFDIDDLNKMPLLDQFYLSILRGGGKI